MRRQPKPFAVEIKRSRRPSLSAARAADLLKNEGNRIETPAVQQEPKAIREPSGSALPQSASSTHPQGEGHAISSAAALTIDDRRPRILPCLTLENADTAVIKGKRMVAKKVRARKAIVNGARKEPGKTRAKKAPPQHSVAQGILIVGDESESSASLLTAAAFPDKAAKIDRSFCLTRVRRDSELCREDAAILPRGQRWKRRLHPRAW